MNIHTVTARGLTLGDGIPKVCIPVTARSLSEIRGQMERILEAPFDMVEWRGDFFEETEQADWIRAALETLRFSLGDKPLLFTFRTKEEGGERKISPEEYERLNLEAAGSGLADFVDVELNRGRELLEEMTEKIHALGGRVIGSFHDFGGTRPKEETIDILTVMQDCGVDITKAAMMPKTERDVMELLEAALLMKERYADRPYITMSMGRLGAVSRLAGGLTGSAVTFATAGRPSAPGQLEAEALSRLLPML